LKPDSFRSLANILGLSETELESLDFNISENRNEQGDPYSIVLFFDTNLPMEIGNKISGLQKDNVVVIPIKQLGLK